LGRGIAVLVSPIPQRKAGYLSHATAVHLHALTAHPSNTVYVNFEQTAKRHTGKLSQESIDRAFANRQRRTNYVFAYRDAEIAILSGKQTGRLGVTKKEISGGNIIDATNIERTLVDITVRPDYSSGVKEVLL
jgi:predicted transcriptional regulator of viral defense system